MNSLLDKIEVSDLPEHLQPMAEAIGLSAVKALIVKCSGSTFYIPKAIKSSYNAKYIKDNFRGDNYQELSDHLGITVRSVYRSLK